MKEGWVFLFNATKFHYFRDGKSLCGKWAYLGTDFEDSEGEDSGDCKACARKRNAEKVVKQ